MQTIWIVQWGAWSYIVSQRTTAINMFPAQQRLPQFEIEAEALLYCECLNAMQQLQRLLRSLSALTNPFPLLIIFRILGDLHESESHPATYLGIAN